MKHLRHQNRKKEVYEGDFVIHSGLLGDFWGGKGAKGTDHSYLRVKQELWGPTNNSEVGAGRVQGGCEEGARRARGGCNEGAGRVQGGCG